MPTQVVDALRRHRATTAKERLAFGTSWPNEWKELVFVSMAGTPLNPRDLRRLAERADVGHLTRYDLRHSAATLLAASGVRLEEIAGGADDDDDEIQSLGRTLASWRTEILEHHNTGASNGPTEGLNLCVKKVKRCGHGFRTFKRYRLRVLLHAGGVTWPTRPSPPHIRTRAPHSVA